MKKIILSSILFYLIFLSFANLAYAKCPDTPDSLAAKKLDLSYRANKKRDYLLDPSLRHKFFYTDYFGLMHGTGMLYGFPSNIYDWGTVSGENSGDGWPDTESKVKYTEHLKKYLIENSYEKISQSFFFSIGLISGIYPFHYNSHTRTLTIIRDTKTCELYGYVMGRYSGKNFVPPGKKDPTLNGQALKVVGIYTPPKPSYEIPKSGYRRLQHYNRVDLLSQPSDPNVDDIFEIQVFTNYIPAQGQLNDESQKKLEIW